MFYILRTEIQKQINYKGLAMHADLLNVNLDLYNNGLLEYQTEHWSKMRRTDGYEGYEIITSLNLFYF